ncbi:MAG: hypothetical protein ACE5J5_01225 [Candidatus Hydrothermarchaeales archaeon]
MEPLKIKGHLVDSSKAHVNIETKFETWGFLPFCITGQECKLHIKIENVGNISIPMTDFRWHIYGPKLDFTEDPHHQLNDISEVELKPNSDPIERSDKFIPQITGQYLVQIEVIDEKKKDEIMFHSGILNFGKDYERFFESYSGYIIGILIGTVPVGILAIIEIISRIIPILIKLIKIFK